MIEDIIKMQYQYKYDHNYESPRYILMSPDKHEELLQELIEKDIMKYQSLGCCMETFRGMKLLIVNGNDFVDIAG